MAYPRKRRAYASPYSRRVKRRKVLKPKYSAYRAKKRYFTKAVKKLIQSTAEVKHANTDVIEYNWNPGGGITNAAMGPAICLMGPTGSTAQGSVQISQGDADGARVGNSCRTKSARLKVLMQPNILNAAPVILQLFVGYIKQVPGTLPSAFSLTQIFDMGSSVAAADGTPTSLMWNINRDYFTIIHYSKTKLGGSNTSALASNNDFPALVMKTINLKTFNGVLKFNDNNANPTNKQLYLFANWVNPALPAGGDTTHYPQLSYYVDYAYTDV